MPGGLRRNLWAWAGRGAGSSDKEEGLGWVGPRAAPTPLGGGVGGRPPEPAIPAQGKQEARSLGLGVRAAGRGQGCEARVKGHFSWSGGLKAAGGSVYGGLWRLALWEAKWVHKRSGSLMNLILPGQPFWMEEVSVDP